jgi:hypothetical protein
MISAPLPDGATTTGLDYNRLRQDVLGNHDHSGTGEGATISHLDLADVGTNTHEQIDSELDAINSKVTFGRFASGSIIYTNVNDVQVTFAEAMPSADYMVFLQLEVSNGHADKENIVLNVNRLTKAAEGFQISAVWTGADNLLPAFYSTKYFLDGGWAELRINWMAVHS